MATCRNIAQFSKQRLDDTLYSHLYKEVCCKSYVMLLLKDFYLNMIYTLKNMY